MAAIPSRGEGVHSRATSPAANNELLEYIKKSNITIVSDDVVEEQSCDQLLRLKHNNGQHATADWAIMGANQVIHSIT